MAIELFSDGTCVRVVNDKSTEKKEVGSESKIARGKLDNVLQALEKN